MAAFMLMNLKKAQLLNDFVTQQTNLDESNTTLKNLAPCNGNSELGSLASGKASGPNGLNYHILKELSKELAEPLCSFFQLFPR